MGSGEGALKGMEEAMHGVDQVRERERETRVCVCVMEVGEGILREIKE